MVGDRILRISRYLAFFLTGVFTIVGAVFIFVGIFGSTNSHGEQIIAWYKVWIGIGFFISLIFVWIGKVLLDGYGLIVTSSEMNLKLHNVKTFLDEIEEAERKKQANSYKKKI